MACSPPTRRGAPTDSGALAERAVP